jgi:hypothetical protein
MVHNQGMYFQGVLNNAFLQPMAVPIALEIRI